MTHAPIAFEDPCPGCGADDADACACVPCIRCGLPVPAYQAVVTEAHDALCAPCADILARVRACYDHAMTLALRVDGVEYHPVGLP
jgi:hypothetical protein